MGEKKIERLWKIKDVMEYTNIPRTTIMLYVAQKRIPSMKIGNHRLFDPDEIRKWVKRFAS